MPDQFGRQNALAYHEADPPGKIAIQPTKPVANQNDLALAYSPGVAHACMAIHEDEAMAPRLTARGNLVGVITNGTAVLGLGDIGPLASKPVMEGKGVLFKKFAGIDVFDIEVAETEVEAFVEAVARLEPTFGGINLEDIKAPECFEIERQLEKRACRYSGLPRRSARNGDRGRCRDSQRAQGGRQGTSEDQTLVMLRRGCCSTGLPQSAWSPWD